MALVGSGIRGTVVECNGFYGLHHDPSTQRRIIVRVDSRTTRLFFSFPLWVTIAWFIAVFGSVLGMLLILVRSKLALEVLAVSFIAMFITSVCNFFLTNGLEMLGTEGAVFSAVIFVIALLLVGYTARMKKRGVLSWGHDWFRDGVRVYEGCLVAPIK